MSARSRIRSGGAGGAPAPAVDACSRWSTPAHAGSAATTAIRAELRLLDAAALPGRLALSPGEAAAAIGCSRTFFDEHVIHELRVVRLGRRRFIAVAELNRWLEASASRALEGA